MTRTLTELGLIDTDRCECTGECGRPHRKSGDDRCHVTDHPAHPLALVAPGKTLAEAVGLPPSELAAWCGACVDHAARIERQHLDALAEQRATAAQLDLFDTLTRRPA